MFNLDLYVRKESANTDHIHETFRGFSVVFVRSQLKTILIFFCFLLEITHNLDTFIRYTTFR